MSEDPVFPVGIAQIIAEYCAELRLYDRIHPKLVSRCCAIYANPLAFDAGMLNLDHIDPRSPDFGNMSLCAESSCRCLSFARTNMALKDFMLSAHGMCVNRDYDSNVAMASYAWCIKNCGLPKPSTVSMAEIDELCNDTDLIHDNEDDELYWMNPSTIEDALASENPCIDLLSSNPHPLAIEFLWSDWSHLDQINNDWFVSNPGIFRLHVSKKLVKLLSRRRCTACGK
jgi:hypothetical protein